MKNPIEKDEDDDECVRKVINAKNFSFIYFKYVIA